MKLPAMFLPIALAAASARAQTYIGFVYPAGGQQGTTFRCTLGGQRLEGLHGARVTGDGVRAELFDYNKKMNPQETQILREQLRELRELPPARHNASISNLTARIEKLLSAYVQQPQCASIANLAVVEVTIDSDAPPGEREIRLITDRGVSNPMPFHVGQLSEYTGEPLPTSHRQILGKEAQSLRKVKREPVASGKHKDDMMSEATMARMSGSMADIDESLSDVDDAVVTIRLPCTLNGQIASGAVDRYRFSARRGARLVITTRARSLVPYLADAVPGWFQPVLELCDAHGREIAYNDDYRFKPDPVIFCQIPADGEYILAVRDAIFRGREDFVYRIDIGDLPFVTSAFPLGGQIGIATAVDIKGFNLAENRLTPPTVGLPPGICRLHARGRGGVFSNPVPFALDTLSDGIEIEPNNTPAAAQTVAPPLIMNGAVGVPGDRDVYRFPGRAGQEIVAEIYARRLDSPLDSNLALTDACGRQIAFNDDHEDPGSGLNTHHADSYLRARLTADGVYFLTVADTQHKGGETFAYRLRISATRPDFELRAVPSRIVMRSNGSATVTVHAIRRDGFAGDIRFRLASPVEGFSIKGGTLIGTQTVARLTVSTKLAETDTPVPLIIHGVADIGGEKVSREVVGAEDRMQAFLWRHLVPAQELVAYVHPRDPDRSARWLRRKYKRAD